MKPARQSTPSAQSTQPQTGHRQGLRSPRRVPAVDCRNITDPALAVPELVRERTMEHIAVCAIYGSPVVIASMHDGAAKPPKQWDWPGARVQFPAGQPSRPIPSRPWEEVSNGIKQATR